MSHLRRALLTLCLALLPGLCLTLIALVHYPDGPPSDGLWEAVPWLVAAGLVVASWLRFRELRVWSLPALGYLIGVGLPSLIDLLLTGPHSDASATSNSWWFLWILGTAVVAAFILWYLHRVVRPFPTWLWLLLALALLAQPWVVVTGGMLLLPAALALLLAQRHGARATLLVLAALYWPVASIFDPGYAILIWSPQVETQFILTRLPGLLFLLVAPAGLLLARSRLQTMVAVLAPVALGLLAGELWRSTVFAGTTRGSYDLSMWFTRGGAILQYTLFLAWALAGCWWYQERSPMAEVVEMAPARR